MEEITSFDIRLSRLPLALLFLAGSFFLFAGLEIGFLHIIIPPFNSESTNNWAYYAFLVFMIGCGGLISIQMLLYLIKPPIMFRASPDGISFGCGFRYNLFTIPWRYVDSIKTGLDMLQLAANQKIYVGLEIVLKQSKDIPSMKATSIGVAYALYTLTLSWFYMETSTRKSLGILKNMQAKFTIV